MSLGLVIFSADFGLLLKYCLHPDREPISYFDARTGPDSRHLLRLIDQNRIRQLRKEQKIKKIINFAFRILLKKFLLERYGPICHVPRKLSLFSLTYNRSFFAKIQKCDRFMRDFREVIQQIQESLVSTIRADLRRFLKHVERFILYDRPELDKRVALEQFFDLRNKDNRRQGIKIPWTEAQYKESIDCVMEEAGLIASPDN